MMESGPPYKKARSFVSTSVHLFFRVPKIVFSGVVSAQLSNTPRAIKNELFILCSLLRESDLHRGLLEIFPFSHSVNVHQVTPLIASHNASSSSRAMLLKTNVEPRIGSPNSSAIHLSLP